MCLFVQVALERGGVEGRVECENLLGTCAQVDPSCERVVTPEGQCCPECEEELETGALKSSTEQCFVA